MAENMSFLPKAEVLSLEELARLCNVFIDLGVKKLRLTGGEPLVRRNIMWLVRELGARLGGGGLDELTVTTNGSQLAKLADQLADAGRSEEHTSELQSLMRISNVVSCLKKKTKI